MEEVTQEQQEQQEQQETSETSWEEQRATFERQVAELSAKLQSERISSAFYRKAIAAGIANPDKLAGIVNLSGVTIDEEGNVNGIEEILAAFTAVVPRQKPREIGGPGGPAEDRTTRSLLTAAADKARASGRPEDVAEYTALKRKIGGNA